MLRAAEIASAVLSGERTAREVVQASLDQVAATRPLNATLHCDASGALAAADVLARAIASGKSPGPLAGVPVAAKDIVCDAGAPCTCGSRILEG